MSQFYLNGPSTGCAMSAEEFVSGTAGKLSPGAFQRPGPQPCPPPPPANGCGCGSAPVPMPPMPPAGCDCGCGGSASDCPGSDCPGSGCGQGPEYCQQMICCCRPVSASVQPPQVEEGCCCKQSFRAALSLLCDQQISSYLDFDTAAFLTNTYSAGAPLEAAAPAAAAETDDAAAPRAPVPSVPPTDNLPAALEGSFRRFSPSSYDLLEVDAAVYDAAGTAVGFTATQVSLCQLDAVVIQGAAATAEGDLTAAEVAARNFRCVRQRLSQRLNPCGGSCGQTCSCACDSRDCCCAAGLLATLAQDNISRRVSLVAGLLVLTGATLLGTVGNVLVLSNDTENRLYFVCVNSVQFIG